MHEIIIPDWLKAHVRERRGALHAFAGMVPEKTALLVVDLQRGFMDAQVAHPLVPEAVEIVPTVNELARCVRKTGGTVVFIRTVMIADANAARTDAAHNASLQNFYLSFGGVMTAGEAQGHLLANAGGNAATA
jgi:nicotinamidase-related amidase